MWLYKADTDTGAAKPSTSIYFIDRADVSRCIGDSAPQHIQSVRGCVRVHIDAARHIEECWLGSVRLYIS